MIRRATPMRTFITYREWRTRRFSLQLIIWRKRAGGPGVRVFGKGRGGGPKPGILTGNGSVFIGTKGIMATSNRGEGVWLLPAARWKEYVLPPPLLTRSPGHM